MIVLDSNIVIGFVRGDARITRWMDRQRANSVVFYLSTIGVTELLSYKDAPIDELLTLERWLKFWFILDVDLSIARTGAEIRKKYALKTVDSIIAATAVVNRSPLASRDQAFRKITELDLIVP